MTDERSDPDDRPLRPAIWRGLRCKCPNCGDGQLFDGYLKVRTHCPVCQTELHHHRADDGPAYLVILVVGHLMAPIMLLWFELYRPAPLIMAAGLTVGCVALSLFLLPRMKGMIVAIQWSRRMHGFGNSD